MHRILSRRGARGPANGRWLLAFVLLLVTMFLLAPAARASQEDEAPLVFANRDIVVLRATVAGMTPRERAAAARARLAGLDEPELARPVSTGRLLLDGASATPVLVGGMPVFAIGDADLDPLAEESAEAAAARAARRLAQALALGLGCCYLWLTFVLRRFPYTEPWGDAPAASLWRQLGRLGASLAAALPGLFTVLLIMTLAWLATRALRAVFRAVEAERIALPLVYADTARPTSWLLSCLVWLFALATAYPYIPASETPAFKGISVVAGLMATLGSAGVVSRTMRGLILLYARAIAKGETVSISDCEGVVSAVDLLSTTVPVGYDKSWRQVTAMLQEAARQTEGVRRDLPARVMQRELTAFHVSYELVAAIEDPARRPFVLDALLGNIQDQFKRYGVQIMTPSFQDQPEEKVIVPAERWYAAPATPPAAPSHPHRREHGRS